MLTERYFVQFLFACGILLIGTVAALLHYRRTAKALQQRKGNIATIEASVNDGDEISVVGQVLSSQDLRRFDVSGKITEQGAIILHRAKDLTKTLFTVKEFWLFDDSGIVKVKMPEFASRIEMWDFDEVVSGDGYKCKTVFEGGVLFVKGRAQWMQDDAKPVHPQATIGGSRYVCLVPLQNGKIIISSNHRFHGSLMATSDPAKIPRVRSRPSDEIGQPDSLKQTNVVV
jgi:hypothetical protein